MKRSTSPRLLALLLTAALSLGLAGCGPADAPAPSQTPPAQGAVQPSPSARPQPTPAPAETPAPGGADYAEVLEADLVVVGAGGAGIAAAMQGVQNGLKVVVLEKLGFTGGTCALAHGIFAVGSEMQQEMGIDDTPGELFTRTMDYHHWLADPAIVKTLMDKSASTIDWMLDLGVQFNGVTGTGTSAITWHNPTDCVGDALSVIKERAEGMGATFLTATPAVELVMEHGAVAGVVAEKADGSRILVKAPAALMASGGFSNNREMFYEYTPFDFDKLYCQGLTGRDGDGINMGLSAGADLAGMSCVMLCGGVNMTLNDSDYANFNYARAPFLWLNQDGLRFADESICGNFSFTGDAMSYQKEVYSVLDSSILDWIDENGNGFNGGDAGNGREELMAAIDGGAADIYVADTVEELAEQMGMDPAVVAETIGTYNQYCAEGYDRDYGKKTYLNPLTQAPYYGLKLAISYYTTVGGLKINAAAEVLDTDGNTIPGLYAAGSDAGGLYGDAYDVIVCAGSQVGFAVNFGRIAADSAKAYLGK